MTHITKGYSLREQRVYCGMSHSEIGTHTKMLTKDEAMTRWKLKRTWSGLDICTKCIEEMTVDNLLSKGKKA